jgi:hypothetical protein
MTAPGHAIALIALHMRMIRRRAGGQADSGWISPQAADRAGDRRYVVVVDRIYIYISRNSFSSKLYPCCE